jgi:uncharacterized protein YjiS (DUF1127 family)
MSVATFSSCDLDQPTVRRHPLRVAALWSLLRKKAAQRNLRRQLYGIEPRLLDDMGFDPADVYDAFHGGVGEVHGDRFRGLFPSRCAR